MDMNVDGSDSHKWAVCEKCCGSNHALTAHRQSHSAAEKPFECSVCSERFTRRSNLATHGRIHREDNVYTCRQSGRAFGRSEHVDRHMIACASISLHGWGGHKCVPPTVERSTASLVANQPPPLLSSSHSPSFPLPERCKVSQQVWNRVMN